MKDVGLLAKAPLCKGSSREAGEGLLETESHNEAKIKASYNPSVIFLGKCHLPLHKGGFKEKEKCSFISVQYNCGGHTVDENGLLGCLKKGERNDEEK